MTRPYHIVIVGGGTSGWMAANLFARHWKKNQNVAITLVESPNVSTIGVGEGSTPTLKRFFDALEIDEKAWMPYCNATYKVNIRFNQWSPQSGIDSYSHPFVSQTDAFTQRAFIVNARTRRLGLDTHTQPDDFFLNGALAAYNKGPKTPENFPFKMEYGYHFDSHKLGNFLSTLAVDNGVKHISAHVKSITKNDVGDIQSIALDNESHIHGDFFVDCTGFSSLLMEKSLGVGFRSFANNLFNDSAVVLPTPTAETIPSETTSTALSAGWAWKIPLAHRIGHGYVYSSSHIDADSAECELRKHLNCTSDNIEARHLKMRVGQLEKHWDKNCLAIGLSQGFIEPLEATALHLVQISIELFLSMFDKDRCNRQQRENYNNSISTRFERTRDYIVAHYKLNTRSDSNYWIENRENRNISDSLAQLLSTWFNKDDLCAEIARQDISTHFTSLSWHALLAGYGSFPDLAPNQPRQGDLYIDQKIQQFLQRCSLNFSSHEENLRLLDQ
ncbi:tryptophan 7-halogenase [Simiduia curdlanivorans]|uniref:Tryptophan halogenase family protein n=1 Tax=Simiduia curdlanivorans TaxID=1492769 RepID=A0ABV8V3P2_9GAMM|nr:tryptophan halogenase family protein [Simiduia curdlanivorans]MDN3638224.1 tryptophan 7-halogenase [Simiduia curdlanivorans]